MRRFLLAIVLVATVAFMFACGGGNSSNNTNAAQGALFVTGEDNPPLPSVLAFNVTINSITLNNTSGSVSVLSTPTTVDFARLVGLRTLLGFNTVAAGTYTSATFTLAAPKIVYLDLGPPASAKTLDPTFFSGGGTTASVTVALPHPLTVTESGLAGLKMHFDLRQSLKVDLARQLTGEVDPKIDVKAVAPSDDDAQVTDLRGSFVSANVAGGSFVIQRPGGRQITIVVNSSTKWNDGFSLGNLAAPAVIEVDGTVQRDGSILATAVEVFSVDRAVVAGRIISVNPTTGPAQTVTILVGEEFPDQAGVTVGMPYTVDIHNVQIFRIRMVDNWLASFAFNNSSLVPGQRIAIGGALDGSLNLVPSRVVLLRQGVLGDLVQNSVNIVSGNQGSFQIQNGSMFGYLLGAPLDVSTSNMTRFFNINGLTGLQAAGTAKVATYGLILKDNNGNPHMYAHRVAVLP